MAQNRKDNSSGAVAVLPKGGTVARQSPGADAHDPERIVADHRVGETRVVVTARDAQRGGARAYQRQVARIVESSYLAAAVADGLCTLTEIDTLSVKALGVRIEGRRHGVFPAVSAGDAE